MIRLAYDEDIGNVLTVMMPKWKEIDGKIRNNSRFVNNRVLFLAHKTVKYKLEFAFFHKATLFKAYHLQSTHAKTLLKRCMTENVIINLSSSLDAIAHEINQINGFSIPFYKVQIDHHRHGEGEGKHCLRCKLDGKNSNLADFVKTELPRRIPNQQNSEHWYFDFQEYRNQIIHRTIYVLMLEPGMDFLPDDPTILDPTINGVSDVSNYVNPIYPNYTIESEAFSVKSPSIRWNPSLLLKATCEASSTSLSLFFCILS